MAVLIRTHTKTYALMGAWASTIPHECGDKTGHKHVHVGDICAVDDCDYTLLRNQECYAVTELPRDANDSEQWVCWRHVRLDDDPIRV